jgi:protein-tyrosine-phosphatase
LSPARQELSARKSSSGKSQDPTPIYNVLFLCTGNSARSILAEAALARLGAPHFRAYSAGSHPKDVPHPMTLETLSRLGYETKDLRSKSWEEFAGPGRPKLDFIFTVCDGAAGEACPIWPGQPVTAHWGVRDPGSFKGSPAETLVFFEEIHDQLAAKIAAFVRLELASLSPAALSARLDEIGKSSSANS